MGWCPINFLIFDFDLPGDSSRMTAPGLIHFSGGYKRYHETGERSINVRRRKDVTKKLNRNDRSGGRLGGDTHLNPGVGEVFGDDPQGFFRCVVGFA